MAIDKWDLVTQSAISAQAAPRVRKFQREVTTTPMPPLPRPIDEDTLSKYQDDLDAASQAALAAMADKSNALPNKRDLQLSRVEFSVALVKVAIDRFIKSKQLDDVSDALLKLLVDYIAPVVRVKAPPADRFRAAVCYTPEMSDVLWRLAPSLRTIFAGLALATYETSRTYPPKLPKPKENKKLMRENETWIRVTGLVSLKMWRNFLDALALAGCELRERTLCFAYSVMCVVDSNTEEGQIKQTHLPFEGFCEAIVRLATAVPLPTDEMLSERGVAHAGALMAALEAGEVDTLKAMSDAQACPWGEVPEPSVSGQMMRRTEHLVDCIVRKVKVLLRDEERADEELTPLTRREFRAWAISNMGLSPKLLPETWAQEKNAVGEAS